MPNTVLNILNFIIMREELIDFSYYEPQKNGEIYSKFRKKLMTNKNKTRTKDGKGYIFNTYKHKDGTLHLHYRHRVIWYFFNGIVLENMEIDHIDGNKGNNSLENLRIVTRKENCNNPVTRDKMMKTVWHDEERNRKISQANVGKVVTEEQKIKQSIAMKGKYLGIKRPNHSELMKKAPRDKFGRFIKKDSR